MPTQHLLLLDSLIIGVNASIVIECVYIFNPLHSGPHPPPKKKKKNNSIFANSDDPDEMQHNAAFHQGPQYLKSK